MSVNCTQFNSINKNGICIFIPKIHPRFNFRSIKGVFIRCGFGFIERVNVTRNSYFKSATVIFRADSWNERNSMSKEVLKRLQVGESIKIKPDDEKAEEFPDEFWMVFVNSQDRNKSVKAPRPKIQFVPKPAEKVTRPVSPTYGPPEVDETPNEEMKYERDEQDLDA